MAIHSYNWGRIWMNNAGTWMDTNPLTLMLIPRILSRNHSFEITVLLVYDIMAEIVGKVKKKIKKVHKTKRSPQFGLRADNSPEKRY